MRADRLPVLALCCSLLFVACKEEPAPVVAAKAFASAVRARDTKALLEVVDGETLAYIEAAAARASDQIGGRRSVDPSEMLQVVDVDARSAILKAELLSESGDVASVRLVGADGTEHDLELVLEDGAWKVSLPTPPTPAGGPPTDAGKTP